MMQTFKTYMYVVTAPVCGDVIKAYAVHNRQQIAVSSAKYFNPATYKENRTADNNRKYMKIRRKVIVWRVTTNV